MTSVLAVNPTSVTVGDSFTITGSGYGSRRTVYVYSNGAYVFKFRATTSGTFTRTMYSELPTGPHVIKATDTLGNTASATVQVNAVVVEPPPTPPPPTGTMLVGLDVGQWGSGIAAEVNTCVPAVRMNLAQGTGQVAGFAAAGLAIVALIEGPYNSGGVAALDPVAWTNNAVAAIKAAPAIKVFEVLNEPGGTWFWGSGAKSAANAAAYARLLKTVRAAFDANFGTARPKLLASWDGGYASGSDWGALVLAADPAAYTYADAITVHPYGGTADRTASALGNRASVQSAHDATGMPVYITEVGWATAVGQPPSGASLQWTEAEQATNTTNFVAWARAEGYIAAVTFFNYRDYGTNDWYGVTRLDGSHKPLFAALAAVSR